MNYALKGDFVYSENQTTLKTQKDGWLVCVNGRSKGVFEKLPEEYQGLPVRDYSGKLIIPGMVDLHLHAPQYAFRGLHMDAQLLDWLNQYAFVEEAKFRDKEYAERAYGIFASAMQRSATTRAVIFATAHREATEILMDKMEQSGLVTYVGKVNMDRNAPDDLVEASAELSLRETQRWLEETENRYQRTEPILTPRFIPSCTPEVLEGLQKLVREKHLPVQSHLSENPLELELVEKLMPERAFYGDCYEHFDLFGAKSPTIMAHCIYCVEEEIELMRRNGVYIAHCPSSNMNIGSGIAPVRSYLDRGMRVGLGSDVAGGECESIFGEMKKAIELSKLYQRYLDAAAKPLTLPEAFWMATVSGGEFFGKVGSFAQGFELDAVVLDDEREAHPQPLDLAERLERSVYLGADKNHILAKFVCGEQVL